MGFGFVSGRMGLMRTLGVCFVAVSLGLAVKMATGTEDHWAYQRPLRPPLPAVVLDAWPAGAIDTFTLAAMERHGWRPSPPADKETLIRRVTLDLTGILPTPEEVAAFVADERPDAYERLVDRLLSSPRYGERMAVLWLDLARYADTHGYHMDAHRDMWRWRDWVIEAYNDNLPFNRFTIEQLAGDLLPEATLAQRIATGFQRNNMINFENGVLAEEFLVEYVADRVATFSTVWLGQTMVCARCHDHKYDPFTQRDFYGLFAFFNNVPEQGVDGGHGNAAPFIPAPLPQQEAELQRLHAQMAAIREQMAQRAQSIDQELANWASQTQRDDTRRMAVEPALVLSFDKAESQLLGATPEDGIYVPGKLGQALLFDGNTHAAIARSAGKERTAAQDAARVTFCLWAYPTTNDHMTMLTLAGDGAGRVYQLELDEGRISLRTFRRASEPTLLIESFTPLSLRRWQHLAVRCDASGPTPVVSLFVDGKSVDCRTTEEAAEAETKATKRDELLLIGSPEAGSSFRGLLDDLRIYDSLLPDEDIAVVAGGDPVGEILTVPAQQRTQEQNETLRRYYLERVDERYRELHAKHAAAERQLAELTAAIPTTMVMAEMSERRPTFILERGRYDLRGEQIVPGVPAALPPLVHGPPSRLSLARWLVDPQHPLTARVTANRLWQQFFGAGIVRTPEDFGLRGEAPTHPELLDWLAVEFAQDWDVKRIVRTIVTSATYRQSSRVDDEMLARDPENRWLARAPRLRLEAEMIRDNALAVSGMLVEQLGGPSVFPYQPEGLWEEISYDPNGFTAQVFLQSHGRDLYRRSLYTFWKRTAPSPTLAAFDAQNRETCVVRRPRTNTSQQALTLMNDVTFVEAARVLAQRSMAGATSPDEIVAVMFRRAAGRLPTDPEQRSLVQLFADVLQRYRDEPDLANELAGVGEAARDPAAESTELAAWTAVANVILSLDAVITRN